MARRPRRDLIPNANSPQLLARLVDAVAQGVRSSRGLQEVLGVDLRTVNYYTQAAEWLDLVETSGEVCLTSLGLEFAYAGDERNDVYARAVWGQPFVAKLMLGRAKGVPETPAIAELIAQQEPDLASATVLRRASAVRSLIAPALGAGVARPPATQHQLALPLALHVETTATPKIERATSHEYNPDVYRFLLGALLDHGELSLGQVRALLDKAEASTAPIGGYVDLALSRGDATRLGERIVVSRAAIAARDLVETTTSIVLSDAGYRAYLTDMLASGTDGHARMRRDQGRRRYRTWDHRLFGRDASPATLLQDLEQLLLERSLDSFPIRGQAGIPLAAFDGSFLNHWREPHLGIAAPPYLAQLQGGVPAANRLLKTARRAANDVREPAELDRYFTHIAQDGAVEQPDMAEPDVGLICVPTTLSAGEFNFTAGCTDTVREMKQLFRHPKHAPQCIVLDPAVTRHTPEWLWLSTGVRAVDHAVEDLCSRDSHPFVDGTATHALRLLGHALPRVKADPEDLRARLDCQMGAWMSMSGALAGVTKGASHGIGHVLGGTANVPHGHTSCVMLPSVMRYNRSINADQQTQVSAALGRDNMAAADVLHDLIAGLDQPTTLRSVGVKDEQLDVIARNAMHDRWIHTNPRSITEPDQVREILNMAW